METLKTLICVRSLLALLLLFHSCTVYKTGNITLDEAVSLNTKTKIEYTDGKITKFRAIRQTETGTYYGVNTEKYKGSTQQYKLSVDESKVSNLMVKDKKKSTIISLLIPTVIVGNIILAVSNAKFDYGPIQF